MWIGRMPSRRLSNSKWDAGLMSSNLQVLGQFVTSLNRMSSEVLNLAVGPEAFPLVAVNYFFAGTPGAACC